MTEEAKTGFEKVELEMVIRDKDGKIKSIDRDVVDLKRKRDNEVIKPEDVGELTLEELNGKTR